MWAYIDSSSVSGRDAPANQPLAIDLKIAKTFNAFDMRECVCLRKQIKLLRPSAAKL